MTTTLITGANKGLGLEVARQLLADGHDVWMAARDETRGRAAAEALGARFVQLDVTDDASVEAAADHVSAETGLDVLVNNAGIVGPRRSAEEMTAQDLAEVLATNLLGVVRVTRAFLPLLARAPSPVVVNVSSGMGSVARTNDPARVESSLIALGYTTSKAALNMLTTQYAKALPGIRINAVDPGYTATDLNANRGTQTIEQGAEAIVSMAKLDPSGPSGSFVDRHGVVPW